METTFVAEFANLANCSLILHAGVSKR